MTKIVVTADSTADLSPELVKENEVIITPLYINFEEESFADNGVDVVPDDIYKFVSETGKLPTTAACPIPNYAEVFKKLSEEGNEVIHFDISSDFSSTYHNARLAAQSYKNIHVVDTRNLSTGIGTLVIEAARMAKSGKSVNEILDEINALIPKVDASFVLDDLTYLHKGGRCSSVAKLGANLLKLKPSIQVKNGKMEVSKKYRGEYTSCIRAYVKDKLADKEDIDKRRIFITHTKCSDEAVKAAIETVKECFDFDEVIETIAGCTVTTHCGPSTLGILFFHKNDLK